MYIDNDCDPHRKKDGNASQPYLFVFICKNLAASFCLIPLFLVFIFSPVRVSAVDFTIGGGDGRFENGFNGMTPEGNVRVVNSIGIVFPTEGNQAALLTNEPDSGSTIVDADVSRLLIENFTIPAGSESLRLDYNFLTDETTPGFTNDQLLVKLLLISAGGEQQLLSVDTFANFFPAPWTGYEQQTGFGNIVADISSFAGTGDSFTLEIKLEDIGDGRRNSAAFIDNLHFSSGGEPIAVSNIVYSEVSTGTNIVFDASASTDDGVIVEYTWDFNNGSTGSGKIVNFSYPEEGIFQGKLTVTDNDGNFGMDAFTVVVGSINHGPTIISPPNATAAENAPYRYQVEVDDPEIDFGDVITYTLISGPAGMTMDPVSGLINWAPDSFSPEKNDVSIKVEDLSGLSDTQSFTIAIDVEVYIIATMDDSRLYFSRSNGNGTFGPLEYVEDTGHGTRGVAIADFDHDGDFDFVSGHGNNSPQIHPYYYERDDGRFLPPVYLGSLGDSTNSAGGWIEDMAAGDFNNDGDMDFVINGDSSSTWLFQNQGNLVFGEEVFF